MKSARSVNVHQAKTELSKLLKEIERGREIIIARNGEPVAKLIPFSKPDVPRFRVDTWKGRLHVARDFDAPLSDAELAEWGA